MIRSRIFLEARRPAFQIGCLDVLRCTAAYRMNRRVLTEFVTVSIYVGVVVSHGYRRARAACAALRG